MDIQKRESEIMGDNGDVIASLQSFSMMFDSEDKAREFAQSAWRTILAAEPQDVSFPQEIASLI